MSTVTIEEAQSRLPDLIARVEAGAEVVILRDQQPVAQLVAVAGTKPQARLGRCRGKLTIVAEDNEHLADFKEYMP